MAEEFAGTIRVTQNPIGRFERFAMAFKPREFEEGQGFYEYSHEHRAEGGFYRCDFTLNLELNDAFDFIRNGLARFVQCYDPDGTTIVWEGLIWEMELDIDSAKIKNSLDNLYNSVLVRYRLPGTGTTLRSTPAEDATSIRRYDKKVMVLSGGEIETTVANQVAAAYLALHKNPKPYPASIDIGEATNRGAALKVYCRGISETWNLRVYNQTALTGNISASTMIQNILGQPNLLQNMVAWWDLEETGADDERLDAYGEYNLHPRNGPTGGAGRVGNAAYLAVASNQHLARPDMNDTDEFAVPMSQPFEIAAWVYLASKPAAAMIIATKRWTAAPAAAYWALRWFNTSDRFEFGVWNAAGEILAQANTFGAPGLNTWYFVSARHDPALTRSYISVNAGAEDSALVPGGRSMASFAGTLAQFNIGGRNGAVCWDGRIDSVGFWRRNLIASERAWLYNVGAGRNFDSLAYMRYVLSADIQANATPVVQVTDMDRRPGDIVRDIARLGDPNNRRWLPYMEENRHFVFAEAARPTYQVV